MLISSCVQYALPFERSNNGINWTRYSQDFTAFNQKKMPINCYIRNCEVRLVWLFTM